jgi:hypothetical protein
MRLVSFNILHGRALTDQRVDLDRLAAAVKFLDADILALQEVDRDQPRSHGADLTALPPKRWGRWPSLRRRTGRHPGATWMAATEDDVPGTASVRHLFAVRYPATWQVLRLPQIRRRFPCGYPVRAR